MCVDKFECFGRKVRVAWAEFGYHIDRGAVSILQCSFEDNLELLPALWGHNSPEMRPRIQARAMAQSRLTVRSEMFSTSAISSVDKPPKKRSSTISA